MKKACDEEAVILHYRPRVVRLCQARWPGMRLDEKIAEAEFFLLCAIRTPHIDRVNFWKTVRSSLLPHMDAVYRRETACRYRCISLDRPIRPQHSSGGATLLSLLPSRDRFDDDFLLHEFLSSLPPRHRAVLANLLDGIPLTQICKRHALTRSGLRRIVRDLQVAYLKWAYPPDDLDA